MEVGSGLVPGWAFHLDAGGGTAPANGGERMGVKTFLEQGETLAAATGKGLQVAS